MSDVLVLGGGIVGCAVAYELTRRGASVAVVERRGIGLGASQASAGMLVPFTEGRHDLLMQALGAKGLEAYDALMRDVDEEAVGYSRTGSLDVALDASGATSLRETARSLTRDGIAHEYVDGAAARSLVPALAARVTAALRIDAHGAVGVPELTHELWRMASAGGARLIEATVHGVASHPGGVGVDASAGSLQARHVVLAAGCWSAAVDIEGAPALPIRPVRGQLLVLRDLPLPVKQSIWGPRCYLVPRPGGVLLVGATVEDAGFDERATAAGARHLLEAACDLVPQASAASFGEMRVGLRPASPDDRPLIGPSSRIDGLVYATGHYRNGALLAPLTAQMVADAIEGRAADPLLLQCAAQRFGSY